MRPILAAAGRQKARAPVDSLSERRDLPGIEGCAPPLPLEGGEPLLPGAAPVARPGAGAQEQNDRGASVDRKQQQNDDVSWVHIVGPGVRRALRAAPFLYRIKARVLFFCPMEMGPVSWASWQVESSPFKCHPSGRRPPRAGS